MDDQERDAFKRQDEEERLAWWRQLKEEADAKPKPEYHPGRPPGMERFLIPGYVKPPRKKRDPNMTMREWLDDFWGVPEPKDPNSPDEKRKRLMEKAVTYTDKRRLIDRYFQKLFGYVVPIKQWPTVIKAWKHLDTEYKNGFEMLLIAIEQIGKNEVEFEGIVTNQVMAYANQLVHREQLRKETAYRESIPLRGPWDYPHEKGND